MKGRAAGWIGIGIMLATAGALVHSLAQGAAQPGQQGGAASRLPAGAVLVLEAKDFGSLVSDWNSSAEKAKWLASDNYQVFSRSRLFLRFSDAYQEFATAAGVPPDMAMLADVAGDESALALYDIGKLEFLYVTRMRSARTMENALWRTRGNFQPREAAGTPFYVRVDPESKRVVAFGVRDEYLMLATRDDLLAGALALSAGQGGRSVESENWFAEAVKAAATSNTGDVRLVTNLTALVKEPHFRSYWIQGNITELKQYRSAISDLVRTPTAIREERVLVRAQEQPPPAEGAALRDIVRLVPDAAGLYRAWTAPSAEEATGLILDKIIAARGASAAPDRRAPRVGSAGATDSAGGEGDLETRIDEEVRAPRSSTYQTAALTQLVGSEALTAMLHVEATRPGADGVFIDRGSVVVLARSTDWPQGAARDAVRTLVDPVWTKAHAGAGWIDARLGSQTFSQLEGLDSLALATRGRLLLMANDPSLLASVLDAMVRPAVLALPTGQATGQASAGGSYAAGFRHGLERERFVRVTRFIDHVVETAGGHEPFFFSENVASLSNVLSRVDSASIVVQDRGATVSQTVTYRLGR